MEDHQHDKPSFMARYLSYKPHFNHEQQSLPRLSPGMPWPAATYDFISLYSTHILLVILIPDQGDDKSPSESEVNVEMQRCGAHEVVQLS